MTDDRIKELYMEQRILRAMRKTLASVVKDATPRPGTSSFLSEETVEQIKSCFALIAARERELSEALGLNPARPVYPDQQPSAKPVRITRKKSGPTAH